MTSLCQEVLVLSVDSVLRIRGTGGCSSPCGGCSAESQIRQPLTCLLDRADRLISCRHVGWHVLDRPQPDTFTTGTLKRSVQRRWYSRKPGGWGRRRRIPRRSSFPCPTACCCPQSKPRICPGLVKTQVGLRTQAVDPGAGGVQVASGPAAGCHVAQHQRNRESRVLRRGGRDGGREGS